MSSAPTTSPARPAPLRWPWVAAALALGAVLVAYPPVRIKVRHPVAALYEPATTGAVAFDAPAFAAKFWSGPLAAASAADGAVLLKNLRTDPAAALRGARRVGLGNAAYFFLNATGRVTAVERSRILVDVAGQLVAIRTGPVFGNVVRDGCGLLEVNQVPGLAEFNALSAELNRLVETTVQPKLAGLAAGATVTVVGCAEAPETVPADGPLLTVIPVRVEVKP